MYNLVHFKSPNWIENNEIKFELNYLKDTKDFNLSKHLKNSLSTSTIVLFASSSQLVADTYNSLKQDFKSIACINEEITDSNSLLNLE